MVQIHCHLTHHSRLRAAPLPPPKKDKNTDSGTRGGEVGVRGCDRQAGCLDLSCPRQPAPRSSRLLPSQPPFPQRQAAVRAPLGSIWEPGVTDSPPTLSTPLWKQGADEPRRSVRRNARRSPCGRVTWAVHLRAVGIGRGGGRGEQTRWEGRASSGRTFQSLSNVGMDLCFYKLR